MFGLALGRTGREAPNNVLREGLGVLRKFGSNAHVYLPGASQVSYGPELVTNGDFSAGTSGWSIFDGTGSATAANGKLTLFKNGAGANPSALQTLTTVVGKTYRIGYDSVSQTGNYQITFGAAQGYITTVGSGLYINVVATSTSTNLLFEVGGAGAYTGVFDNISVREVITTSSSIAGLLSNNFTLSDGSSGYAAVDGVDGLVLDAMGSVGPEQAISMATSAGWSVSAGVTIGGGVAAFSAAAQNSNAGAGAGSAIVSGNTYRLTVTVSSYTSGAASLLVAGGQGIGGIVAAGTYTAIVKATSSGGYYIWAQGASNNTFTISSFSIVEITGIHATQPTTANKPVLRRGLVNLLTYSGDLSNAAWAKAGAPTITAGYADKNGGTSAYRVQSGSSRYVATELTSETPTNKTYTVAAWVRATSSNSTFSICLTSAIVADYFSPDMTATSTYQLFVFTKAFGAGDTGLLKAGVAYKDASGNAVDVLVDGVAVFTGTLTAAQIIDAGGIPLTTSAAASNATVGKYSWQFDGVNDSLALGSVPFQMSDDHCVIAGAVRSNPAGSGCAAVSPASNSGSYAKCASIHFDVNTVGARWTDNTPTDYSVSTAYSSSVPVVVSASKVGNTGYAKVNGASIGTVNLTGLTATLNAGYIGIEGNGGGYINGSIGPVIVIKGTVSDSDLLALERLVASLTPNAPSF